MKLIIDRKAKKARLKVSFKEKILFMLLSPFWLLGLVSFDGNLVETKEVDILDVFFDQWI